MHRPSRRIYRLATALLVVALALPGAAFATPGELASKQAEAAAARAELNRLAVDVELASEDLAEAEAGLEETRGRIDETRERVEVTKVELADAKTQMRDRAAATYRLGEDSYLAVLFGSTNFTDFVSRFDFVQRIGRQDVESIQRVETAQKSLAELEWSLVQREAEQEELRAQARQKRDTLAASVSAQRSVLNALDAEVAEILEADRRRQAEEAARAAAAARAAREAQQSSAPAPAPGTRNQSPAQPAPSNPSAQAPTQPSQGNPPAQAPAAQPPNQGDAAPAPTPPAQPTAPPAGNPGASTPGVIAAAERYLGIPYRFGATGPDYYDCSGFTQRVYADLGVHITRTSRSQFARYASTFIPPNRTDLLQPGDLVFWGSGGDSSRIYHVGIYAGGGSYIHAPQAGDVVRYATLRAGGDYVGAVRP